MHASALDQLHNAGDEHVVSVANGVHLDLFALQVFVHQHRLVLVNFHCGFQILPQMLVLRDNLHRAAAQHKRGAHQHRIADFVRRAHAVLDVGDSIALRTRDVQFIEQVFKLIAVLRAVDGGTVGADNLHAAVS